jgi:hypothetical protein
MDSAGCNVSPIFCNGKQPLSQNYIGKPVCSVESTCSSSALHCFSFQDYRDDCIGGWDPLEQRSQLPILLLPLILDHDLRCRHRLTLAL